MTRHDHDCLSTFWPWSGAPLRAALERLLSAVNEVKWDTGRFGGEIAGAIIEARAALAATPAPDLLDNVEALADALDDVEWHKWQSPQIDRTHTRNLARAVLTARAAVTDAQRIIDSSKPDKISDSI